MNPVQVFFRANGLVVLSVVVSILLLLAFFSLIGVDFNPHRKQHIDKIVTVESFISNIEKDVKLLNDDSNKDTAQDINGVNNEGNLTNIKYNYDLPTQDDSEETGRSVTVSLDPREKRKILALKERQRMLESTIKNQHKTVQTALLDSMNSSSICNPKTSTLLQAHDFCNMIKRPDTCDTNSCCIRLSSGDCVGGDSKGPTYQEKNGIVTNADYYYYMGKCYGKCPDKDSEH